MTAPECHRLDASEPMAKRMTCIESLADGWINAPDLCGTCTQAFMTALDGIAGPLKWHAAYVERAVTKQA